MRASVFLGGCVAFVLGAFTYIVLAGCGGRLLVADCGAGRQYCEQANVCCPSSARCCDGAHCPLGDCYEADAGAATDAELAADFYIPPKPAPTTGGGSSTGGPKPQ